MHIRLVLILCVSFVFLIPMTPSAMAAETQPGAACSSSGAVAYTGGPEQIPRRMLICNGTTWQNALETDASGKSLIQIGPDTGACTTDKTGRLRYTSGTDTWEYCNGSAWVPFEQAGPGCTGPADCTSVGSVCSDGSVFAGCAAGVYEPFFVTRCDAGQSWGGSSCGGTRSALYWADSATTTNLRATGVTDAFDGAANTAALTNGVVSGTGDARSTAGLQTHNAAQYCADLTIHGKSDWYLPSRSELFTMWLYRTAIANFSTSFFWTATEYDATEAWGMTMGGGSHYTDYKYVSAYVRCVRKD